MWVRNNSFPRTPNASGGAGGITGPSRKDWGELVTLAHCDTMVT